MNDLISREAAKEQAKASYHVAESMEQLGNLYEDCINALPSAFEGMTNGEVIQAMFPNSKTETISFNGIRLYIDDEVHTKIADFTYRWWNAPYKGVSE